MTSGIVEVATGFRRDHRFLDRTFEQARREWQEVSLGLREGFNRRKPRKVFGRRRRGPKRRRPSRWRRRPARSNDPGASPMRSFLTERGVSSRWRQDGIATGGIGQSTHSCGMGADDGIINGARRSGFKQRAGLARHGRFVQQQRLQRRVNNAVVGELAAKSRTYRTTRSDLGSRHRGTRQVGRP